MSFGKKIAEFRKTKGITQEKLARVSGVGIAQIRRYEADNSSPTLNVIAKIAIALEVATDDLIFDAKRKIIAKKIIDEELFKQFETVSYLNEHDREAVKTVLEAIIIKNKLADVMPKSSWSKRAKDITDKMAAKFKDYSQSEIDDMVDEAVTEIRAQVHN